MPLTRVIMPKTGADMEQGRIISWMKKEGDRVAKGEVLLEIETDKATMEVEAPESGIVLKHLFAEGTDVPATHLIAALGEGNESAEEIAKLSSQGDAAAPVKTERPAEVVATSQATPKAATGGKVAASPLARRLAQEMGVDLGTVQGSGPGGRIEKEDVLKAAESGEARPGRWRCAPAPHAHAPRNRPPRDAQHAGNPQFQRHHGHGHDGGAAQEGRTEVRRKGCLVERPPDLRRFTRSSISPEPECGIPTRCPVGSSGRPHWIRGGSG